MFLCYNNLVVLGFCFSCKASINYVYSQVTSQLCLKGAACLVQAVLGDFEQRLGGGVGGHEVLNLLLLLLLVVVVVIYDY